LIIPILQSIFDVKDTFRNPIHLSKKRKERVRMPLLQKRTGSPVIVPTISPTLSARTRSENVVLFIIIITNMAMYRHRKWAGGHTGLYVQRCNPAFYKFSLLFFPFFLFVWAGSISVQSGRFSFSNHGLLSPRWHLDFLFFQGLSRFKKKLIPTSYI